MGTFAIGDVLALRFPFSDLRKSKVRPVLVVGVSDFDNLVVCQITSKAPDHKTAIRISGNQADTAGLQRDSYVRANKLFTADPKLIVKKLGAINQTTRQHVHSLLIRTFDRLAANE
ncbi:MAG: type II toxin-antitoxin system PemK/MazF family toxin [Candidatus Saccharibacteria bacterium]|nr:type II toxin-antitoxin system PemK/MazF family toxin [Candidatus Saccharibacteria bacterium]